MTDATIGALDNLRAATQSVTAAIIGLNPEPHEMASVLLLACMDALADAEREVRKRAMGAGK